MRRPALLLLAAVPWAIAACGGEPARDVGIVGPGKPLAVKSTQYQVQATRTARSVRDKYESLSPEGAFMVVTLRVTIIGDQGRHFSPDAVKVVTPDGRTHEPDLPASAMADERAHLLGKNIVPHTPATGDLVFDIPFDALDEAQLRVRDLLSNAYGHIALNP